MVTNEAAASDDVLWLGLEKADVSVYEPGLSMWGWGSPDNVATGAETRLFARALVISRGPSGKPLALVSVELGMVSESVRRAVLCDLVDRGLDIDEHRLAITATHTHSGPSGFSTYLFYALTGPGYSHRVHDAIVKGIVDAVTGAWARLRPGRAYVHSVDIPLVEPVCFNRSVGAYSRNADVTPVASDRSDEAVDRTMTVLRLEDARGRALGLVSVFGVHGTSVHADNDRLHADNKGIAALLCERDLDEGDGFVALFLQGAAGDVTPNYRPCPRRGVTVGRYDHDFESAAHNGEIQARYAMKAFSEAPRSGTELSVEVEGRTRYSVFHEADIDSDLVDGVEDPRTGVASLGLGFCLGTQEGPGPLGKISGFARTMGTLLGMRAAVTNTVSQQPHGRKVSFWELGPGANNRIGGRTLAADHTVMRFLTGRRLRYYRDAQEYRGVRVLPWVPHHLPFQILRIGKVALGFVPFEPTTVAGRRIRAVVGSELRAQGVEQAVVVGYSNAYASYLTTPEEYDEQGYEGAMTLFGKWSLPAACTELRGVCRALGAPLSDADVGALPPRVPLEQWLPMESTP
ncbi:MAG: hypothetical protein HOV80_01960 [Polyangiaceae bacterium]|nr:hypothetical protein [Polyangiaceae bacterium]